MVKYWRLFNVFEVFSWKIGDLHVFSRSVIKVAGVFHVTLQLFALNRTCALIKKQKKQKQYKVSGKTSHKISKIIKFFPKFLPKLIAKMFLFLLFKLALSFNWALIRTFALILTWTLNPLSANPTKW